jgi:hypothetical protein
MEESKGECGGRVAQVEVHCPHAEQAGSVLEGDEVDACAADDALGEGGGPDGEGGVAEGGRGDLAQERAVGVDKGGKGSGLFVCGGREKAVGTGREGRRFEGKGKGVARAASRRAAAGT